MLAEVTASPPSRIFQSGLGWIGFTGTELGMTALTFGHASRDDVVDQLSLICGSRCVAQLAALDRGVVSDDATVLEPHWMQAAQELLEAYCDGEPVDLNQIPCDVPHRTAFERRVREQLSRVGYGQTITYGELAEAAGAPRAARAVGTVMSRNPLPLVIACHRVVAADGTLGGYSAPSGVRMKERLLEMERSRVTLECGVM